MNPVQPQSSECMDVDLHSKQLLKPTSEIGIWIFIFADMCVFALYFGVYAWARTGNLEMYAKGQASLNIFIGSLNTVLLLVSSYWIASGLHAWRAKNIGRCVRYIKLTMMGGFGFLVAKTFEYVEKFNDDYTIITNEFYSYYFAFTGFHLVHVVIGLCLLGFVLKSMKDTSTEYSELTHLETASLYWHMVDLLWVVLFALFYLV